MCWIQGEQETHNINWFNNILGRNMGNASIKKLDTFWRLWKIVWKGVLFEIKKIELNTGLTVLFTLSKTLIIVVKYKMQVKLLKIKIRQNKLVSALVRITKILLLRWKQFIYTNERSYQTYTQRDFSKP